MKSARIQYLKAGSEQCNRADHWSSARCLEIRQVDVPRYAALVLRLVLGDALGLRHK